MIPDSFQVRSATFAFLFPGAPVLSQPEAIQFYKAATDAGLELAELTHTQAEVVLQNRGAPPSRRLFHVHVDSVNKQFRFLVGEDFPDRALMLIEKDADAAWEAFGSIWSRDRVGGRPVVAEVTLRMSAAVGGDATQYLRSRVFKVSDDAMGQLGRGVTGLGMRIMVPVQVTPAVSLPLDGASVNLLVETLQQDRTRLYFEITATWPTVPLPPEVVQAGGPTFLNLEPRRPSEYIEAVYNYLTKQVVSFLDHSRD